MLQAQSAMPHLSHCSLSAKGRPRGAFIAANIAKLPELVNWPQR